MGYGWILHMGNYSWLLMCMLCMLPSLLENFSPYNGPYVCGYTLIYFIYLSLHIHFLFTFSFSFSFYYCLTGNYLSLFPLGIDQWLWFLSKAKETIRSFCYQKVKSQFDEMNMCGIYREISRILRIKWRLMIEKLFMFQNLSYIFRYISYYISFYTLFCLRMRVVRILEYLAL